MTGKKSFFMAKWMASGLFSLLLIVASLVHAEADFMCGVAEAGTRTGPIPYIQELGATWHSPFLQWNHVEPEISQIDLTVDQVRSNPGMIDDYIDTHDWTRLDDVQRCSISSG